MSTSIIKELSGTKMAESNGCQMKAAVQLLKKNYEVFLIISFITLNIYLLNYQLYHMNCGHHHQHNENLKNNTGIIGDSMGIK